MDWTRESFTLTDNLTKINIEFVSQLLAKTYWGHKRPRATVENLIKNSLCFSLLLDNKQIGFARVVTDYTVFSWLSDLVISDKFRNKKIGAWMLDCILNHPSISKTQFVLQTETAHEFYEKFGFDTSQKLMSRPPSTT